MAPFLRWDCICALMLLMDCLFNGALSLDVRNKPAYQNSTIEDGYEAGQAVDGDISTISHTTYESNQWWRLDLQAVYCLKKITIINRMDEYDIRLDSAEVRAGLSENDGLENRLLGTIDYASTDDGARVTTIVADPVVTAHYVRVDLEGAVLQLGEVMVEEFLDEDIFTSTGIPLDGSLASQSSRYQSWAASRAVDRSFIHENPHCSQTDRELNPWWKIDLMLPRCVRKVTVKGRDAPFVNERLRFEGAVVRAGLSSVPTENTMCGSPVTRYEAVANNWIEFDCNPPDGLTARYASVDIPRRTYLALCEVIVLPCDLPTADFTLVANPALVDPTGGNDVVLTAYKGPSDIPAGVNFGRQLTTGGMAGLPPGASEENDPSLNCTGRSLRLPAEEGFQRTGIFYFEASRMGSTTKIQTVLMAEEGSVHIRPVDRTRTANVGDSVRLEMQTVAAPNTYYRWRHNGGDVISSWNDQLNVSIDDVAMSDGGVYSCFALGVENQQLHGIMRLIVQGCSSGKWGPPACLNVCRRCYNGGVCDATTGSCICAPGFSGDHCEQVHGRNVFGQNTGHSCSGTADPHDDACRGRLFCLPDPYGCSCAAGFMALDCIQECPEGKYGADCKQTCHCATGDTCRKDTGQCTHGYVCGSSFFGNNCQCSKTEPFQGEVKLNSIKQRNLTFSWSVAKCGGQAGLPVTGYRYKLTDRSSGTPTLVVNSTTTQTSVVLDGLTPYVVYGFQVAAEGFSTYSKSVVIRTEEAEPTVPLNVTIQNVSEDSITASWMKPDPLHGIITTYEIAWALENGTQELQDVGNVTVYTIKGLQLNLTYQVQVRASTKIGHGPWSEVINERVVGVPGPLQNLRWTHQSEKAVTLDWDPPLKPKGPISGYVVQYREIKTPNQPDFTPTDSFIVNETADGPFVQGNLKPSTVYEFIVSARNRWYVGAQQHLTVYTYSSRGTTDAQGFVPNVVAIVLGVLLAIAVAANIGCVVWRNRDRVRSSAPTSSMLEDPKIELSVVRDPSIQGTESPIYQDVGLPSWASALEIQWQSLTIEDKVLGKGSFGEVRGGSLNVGGEISKVAIKTLKDATSSSSEAFLLECKTMSQIKPHPNIVALMGACMHEDVLFVALEYLPNGNLRDYLRSTRPQQQGPKKSRTDVSPLTSSNLLTFGIDIARGMAHLSDTGIIHRDLAARKILLGEDLTAKVSHFGLSWGKNVFVQKSQSRDPFRWLAIETLSRRVSESKSDVWSFGIVLWEIATFGATPYPGIQSKFLAKRLQQGYRMPKPENCADEIYDLMMKCWQPRSYQRPSFKEITATLQKMHDPSDETIYMSPCVYENHLVIKPEFDDY